ncbi:hypothetical protein GW17_00001928 [Ensete ventricosum]|nr:hypothetical protein GW17_00001928 [Ensete ventricosum]RZR77116.1 hypothetical protein BHM03_00002105 [Ensete ventricosum]
MQITCHISNFLFKDGTGGVSGRTVGSLMSTACDRCPETLNVVASKVEATAVLPQKVEIVVAIVAPLTVVSFSIWI